MPDKQAPTPWQGFLAELNRLLPRRVELHRLGGFALSMLYGLPRPTADLDVLTVIPNAEVRVLQELAAVDTPLHRKFGVCFQHVAIVSVPEDYADRLVEIFPGAFSRLRVFGLEVHDLALSKLERNAPRDREDVKFLAHNRLLDLKLLESRYRAELRPYLAKPERHDLTMRLWCEILLQGELRDSAG